MKDVVNKVSFLFLIFSGGSLQGKCEQQTSKAGASWPIKFKQNAETLPSIEIKLAPPEDPLPQVTAEVQLLERSRMRLEEGLMAKLEDAYNMELDNSQTQIQAAVDRAMAVFDSPDILTGVVQGALLPIRSKRKALKASEGSFAKQSAFANAKANAGIAVENAPFFKQISHNQPTAHRNGPLAPAPPTKASSFLQVKEKNSSKFVGGVLGSVFEPPPSVKVQLTGIKEPDEKIKEKMEEIEQLRTDEETSMFEQAIEEFAQLTKITVQELEKNIQIQMNPFLVDAAAVGTEVENQLPKRSMMGKMMQFREIDEEGQEFLTKKCTELKDKYSDFKLQCGAENVSQDSKARPTSFLEVQEKTETTAKLGFLEKQLNVRLAQSDKAYPTIDEIVHDMQKKRDATERLERMKILELQLKLLKAQDEMIKDALHTNLSRVIAQYGPAIEGIKAEVAIEELRK